MQFEQKDYTKLNWDWGNLVTALRWNRVVSNKMFMNTTASFTRYRSKLGLGGESIDIDHSSTPPKEEKSEVDLKYNSGIQDWTDKFDFYYMPNSYHDIK